MSWRSASNLRWLRELPGVLEAEPMATRTSFGIGGPADFLAASANAETLASMIDGCRERQIPCFILGAGTNLLIADKGIEGLVIRVENRGFHFEGTRLRADAGLKMMRLARLAADHNLRGFEFAIGIPGSLGGAIYQNAGCWGKEIREVFVEARGHVPGMGLKLWKPADMAFGYRTSALHSAALKGALVIEATVQLARGDGEEAKRQMAMLTAERNATQPIKTKNCGSVFRNPTGDSAGRLVQAAGLKGAREGAAVISQLHGNFIVNEGGATAHQVAVLIARAKSVVKARFGVELQAEVEMVGRWK